MIRPLVALVPLALVAVAGCGGRHDSDTASGCGDDTTVGDVPDLLGDWAVQFAENDFNEDCDSALSPAQAEWLNHPMVIGGGIPSSLVATFGGDTSRELPGQYLTGGAMTFAGTIDDPEVGLLQVAVTGIVYDVPSLGRLHFDGTAIIGVDADRDGVIECSGYGDFSAYHSGT